MLVEALKAHISKMPAVQFTKVWTAIEKVEAAVAEAGPLGVVVLEYARLKQAGRQSAMMYSLLDANAVLRTQLAIATPLPRAPKKARKAKKKSK